MTLHVRQAYAPLVPPEPLPLGGYTSRPERPAEKGDTIGVRITVLEQGMFRVAIAAVDLLTIPESLYEEVSRRLPKGVQPFLVATHTHCAPDSQMLNARMTIKVPGIAKFERRWLDWYADSIAEAIGSALSARASPAREVYSHQVRLALNRGRRPGAQPDTLATQVRYAPESPGSRSVLPNLFSSYAAHAVFYGPEESKTRLDWPGTLAALTVGPVLPGAIGDVSPDAPRGSTPAERIYAFIETFQRAMSRRTILVGVWRFGDPIALHDVPIRLGPPSPHPEFAKRYGVPEALAQIVVKQFAPANGVVRVFRIGKLAVVGIPGEPTSELGRRIQEEGRRVGFWPVLTISHVNGWIGYILTPGDYDRGGYEATLSFHGRETGERVFVAAKEAIWKLAGKAPTARPRLETQAYKASASWLEPNRSSVYPRRSLPLRHRPARP